MAVDGSGVKNIQGVFVGNVYISIYIKPIKTHPLDVGIEVVGMVEVD